MLSTRKELYDKLKGAVKGNSECGKVPFHNQGDFQGSRHTPRAVRHKEFRSRNQGSFDFKRTAFGHGDPNEQRGFRSRNRGSFEFKHGKGKGSKQKRMSFDLVIEVLLSSSKNFTNEGGNAAQFQSRNRDSFDFKVGEWSEPKYVGVEFRSRNRDSFNFKYLKLLIKRANLAVSIS